VLEDGLFAVDGLAAREEHIRCALNHEWVIFAEWEAPEGVGRSRAKVASLEQEAQLAHRG